MDTTDTPQPAGYCILTLAGFSLNLPTPSSTWSRQRTLIKILVRSFPPLWQINTKKHFVVVRIQHKYYRTSTLCVHRVRSWSRNLDILAVTIGFILPTALGASWNDGVGGFIWGGLVARILGESHKRRGPCVLDSVCPLVWHCTFFVNSYELLVSITPSSNLILWPTIWQSCTLEWVATLLRREYFKRESCRLLPASCVGIVTQTN